MSALTQDRNTPYKDGELLSFKVAANVKCYAGGIAVLDGGYCRPGRTGTGLIYIGRFEQQVDNSGGAAGAKVVMVRRGKAFLFENSAASAITQADLGQDCYIEDDQTVAKSAGTGAGAKSKAGRIMGVDDMGVWVV